MRHSQLRAFHFVAIYGSFSVAADRLKISQPAVSEQVKKLEQNYDTLLIRRKNKKITLTDEGKKILLLTKQLFEVEQQIEDYISESGQELAGSIRIIADSASHVLNILAAFRKKYPKVKVILRSGNSEEVENTLRSFNSEIGIMPNLSKKLDIGMKFLGSSKIIVFGQPEYFDTGKKTLKMVDLTKLPIIFREKGSNTRKIIEKEAKIQGVNLKPIIEVEGREAMRELVASGAGIGFVSEAEFVADTRVMKVNIQGDNLIMNETVAFLKQRSNVRVIRNFLSLVDMHISVNRT
ncbi:MAG: LysR substrate-binding domain-containing protein [Paracoccaceae bacterium]|nr:LysR substrate-binding domain-containing protein [Paracoccaceae bacterium]